MKEVGYQLIKNFLNDNELLECVETFKKLPIISMKSDWAGPSVYNYPIFLEILCKKLNQVSDILQEPLFPTYCYARKYQTGATLTEHIDRPSCEISLTVHLYGDKKWSFFVKNKTNIVEGFDLEQGDAVLYYGMTTPHWRNEYLGKEYAQLFLHYVRSRGPFKDYYFDNKKEQDKAILKQLSTRFKDTKRD